MSCTRPARSVLIAFLLCAFPLRAQHGGGGHAGGGHSGFGGGHSTGHSVGHSLGHMFGRHSGSNGRGLSGKAGDENPPLAGAAMIHGRVVQLPNPAGVVGSGRRFHHGPVREFGFPRHFGSFGFGGNGFSGFCGSSFGFPNRRVFWGGNFDCFQAGLFFDPLFLTGFYPDTFGPWGSGESFIGPDSTVPPDENQPMEQVPNGEDYSQRDKQAFEENAMPAAPDTLLQLRNGSMYGLRSYWLEADRIHYTTSYGGENAVPLNQIDFGKTIELNAAQGVKFELRPKPLPAPNP